MELARLINAQVLALLDVMALVQMLNAQVHVRLVHTQLVVLLLLRVHLVAQAKRLLQQVVHLPQTVSVQLATLAPAVPHVLQARISHQQVTALVPFALLVTPLLQQVKHPLQIAYCVVWGHT